MAPSHVLPLVLVEEGHDALAHDLEEEGIGNLVDGRQLVVKGLEDLEAEGEREGGACKVSDDDDAGVVDGCAEGESVLPLLVGLVVIFPLVVISLLFPVAY